MLSSLTVSLLLLNSERQTGCHHEALSKFFFSYYSSECGRNYVLIVSYDLMHLDHTLKVVSS